jgi:hypothetical protein
MKKTLWLTALSALLAGSALFAQAPGTCAGMTPGQLTSLNGFVPFQGTSSLWNTDISTALVDPDSANIINFIGTSTTLHPDFGEGTYDGSYMGIPYQIVAGTQPKVNIVLGAYASESDPGPMPIPANALIEGYPHPGDGDRHVLVLDKDGCWLYELYNAVAESAGSAVAASAGSWKANSAAVWDMTLNEMRPYEWTSADAAGLPIFPGLLRYDEVAAGAINHAVRFTVPTTREAFVAPASHWASSNTSLDAPPMGTRLRLKSSFNISGFSAENQVILTALKKYGMILADNGSAIFLTGAPDSRWNNDDLSNLKTLTGADFDVVQLGTVYNPSNLPTGPAPTISSFTATSKTITKGQGTTLNWSIDWNVSNPGYNIISPAVGAVRGSSVAVAPSATTTYTLYSTNEYGRSTAKVTITVH